MPFARLRPTALALACVCAASAQDGPVSLLGAQATFIHQDLRPFASPYVGPNSLPAGGDAQTTQTYGAYVGARLSPQWEAYLDLELFRGAGVGRTLGLAGLPNGDAVRAGSGGISQKPYIARAFARWTLPLGGPEEDLSRGMDQLPGKAPARRLVISAGKLAANDLFDTNAFAGGTRVQFMNWSLWNALAWDFPADTRGYTRGITVDLRQEGWSLAYGRFQMPTEANGSTFDSHTSKAHGDVLQLTLHPTDASTLRLLAFENHARMGDYALALTQVDAPNIAAARTEGRTKRGWVLNAEQALGASGAGLFTRLSWNDGRTESFVFTEADRSASFGGQGVGWRPEDRWGVAASLQDLSSEHRAYLAQGGSGFVLGDGRLNPGRERILEVYFAWAIRPWMTLTPDAQWMWNPGYNRDRGPAKVLGLRLRLAI